MEQSHKQRDLYKILGITKKAKTDDISKAFMHKAKKWHPHKAPKGKTDEETEKIKEKYEQKYLDLKRAYKILINPTARSQYDQTLQNTYTDLRRKDKRDLGYKTSNKYKTEEGKFDEESFAADFNKKRSTDDSEQISELEKKYNQTHIIKQTHIEDLMQAREQELNEIKADKIVNAKDFDVNAFNKMFDHMKQTNPSSVAVQPYGAEPQGLFSGSQGLVEESDLGGMTMNQGFGFQGQGMDQLLTGATMQPTKETLDINDFRTSDTYVTGSLINNQDKNYSRTKGMGANTITRRMEKIQADRERLMNMEPEDFKVTPSEIEQQYSELFELNTTAVAEGLETRKKALKRKSRKKYSNSS